MRVLVIKCIQVEFHIRSALTLARKYRDRLPLDMRSHCSNLEAYTQSVRAFRTLSTLATTGLCRTASEFSLPRSVIAFQRNSLPQVSFNHSSKLANQSDFHNIVHLKHGCSNCKLTRIVVSSLVLFFPNFGATWCCEIVIHVCKCVFLCISL